MLTILPCVCVSFCSFLQVQAYASVPFGNVVTGNGKQRGYFVVNLITKLFEYADEKREREGNAIPIKQNHSLTHKLSMARMDSMTVDVTLSLF